MSRLTSGSHARVGSDTGPGAQSEKQKELPKGFSQEDLGGRNWIDSQFRKKIKDLAGEVQLEGYADELSNLSNQERSSRGKLKMGSSKFPAEESLESPSKHIITRAMSLQGEEAELVEELKVMLRRRELDFEKLANDYEHARASWEIERDELWAQRDEAYRKVKSLEEIVRGLRAELSCRENLYRQQSKEGRAMTYRELLSQYKSSSSELRQRIESRDSELAAARQTTSNLRDSIDRLEKPSDHDVKKRYFSNESNRLEPVSARNSFTGTPRQINTLEDVFQKLRGENEQLRRVVEEMARNRPAPMIYSARVYKGDTPRLEDSGVASLKRQIEMLNSNLQQAKSQNRILSGQLQKQGTQLTALRQHKGLQPQSDLRQSIEKFAQQKAQLTNELASSKAREQQLKAIIDELSHNIDQIAKTNSELQEQLKANSRKSQEQLLNQNDILRQRLRTYTSDSPNLQQFEATIEQLQRQILVKNDLLASLGAEFEKKKEQENSQNQIEEELQKKMRQLENNLIQMHHAADQQNFTMTQTISQGYKKLHAKEQELQRLKKIYEDTLEQSQRARIQVSQLQKSLVTSSSQHRQTDQQLSETLKQVSYFQSLSSIKDQQLSNLRQAIQHLQTVLYQKDNEIQQLREELTTVQVRLHVLEDECHAHQKALQVELQQNQGKTQEIQNMGLVVTQKEQEIVYLKESVERIRREGSGREETHTLKAEIAKLEQTVNLKNSELDGLRRRLSDSHQNTNLEDEQLRHLRQMLSATQLKLKSTEQELKNKQEIIQNQITTHEQELQQTERLVKIQLEALGQRTSDEIMVKDKDITNKQGIIASLMGEIQQRDHTINTKQVELQNIKQALTMAQVKQHILQNQLNGLQQTHKQQTTKHVQQLQSISNQMSSINELLSSKQQQISSLQISICQKENTLADRDLQIQLLKDSINEEPTTGKESLNSSDLETLQYSDRSSNRIVEENQSLKKDNQLLKAEIEKLKVENEIELHHIKEEYEIALKINEELRAVIMALNAKTGNTQTHNLESFAIGRTHTKAQVQKPLKTAASFLEQTAETPSAYQSAVEVLLRKYVTPEGQSLHKNLSDFLKKLNLSLSTSELLGLNETFLQALNVYLKQAQGKCRDLKNQVRALVSSQGIVLKQDPSGSLSKDTMSEKPRVIPKLSLDSDRQGPKKLIESADVSSIQSGQSSSRIEKKPSAVLMGSTDINELFQKEEQQEQEQILMEMQKSQLKKSPDEQSQISKQSIRSQVAEGMKQEVKHKMQSANLKRQLNSYKRHPSKKGSK